MKFILFTALSLMLAGCEASTSIQKQSTVSLQTDLNNKLPGDDEADITVTVLGSGTPVPSKTQFGPSILVDIGDKKFVFDCGRGCSSRLGQLEPRSIKDVDALFVTHLHSDHVMGIADLWLNGWAQGRNTPLEVWGPTGTSDMMEGLRIAYAYDIDVRHSSGLPATQTGIASAFIDLDSDGVIYDRDGIKVTAFLVDHGKVYPAFGYRIDYQGRSIAISGDTSPTENLYTYGKDTDVFLHEVMSPALIKILQKDFAKFADKIVSHHTTAEQAADIFAKTNPRLAVYYHTKNDGNFGQSLVDVTRETYSGPLEVSSDLFQIRVGDKITTRRLLEYTE